MSPLQNPPLPAPPCTQPANPRAASLSRPLSQGPGGIKPVAMPGGWEQTWDQGETQAQGTLAAADRALRARGRRPGKLHRKLPAEKDDWGGERVPRSVFPPKLNWMGLGRQRKGDPQARVGSLLADPLSRTLPSHMCLLGQAELGHTLLNPQTPVTKRKSEGQAWVKD